MRVLGRAQSPETVFVETEDENAEERTWVSRIRSGDVKAFETMYRAYHMRLRAFVANYVRSVPQAEEIVQDLMCRVWEQRAGWHVKGTLRSYLYFAARNRALNAAKRAKLVAGLEDRWRMSAEDTPVPGMSQGVIPPDERLQQGDVIVAIRAAVDALPERARQAWMLRWQHELSHAEIATVMGISLKGVEALLARSTRLLHESLAYLRK